MADGTNGNGKAGEAAKPQALLYRDSMTLLDVMIAVGGLTNFADGNNTTLVRMLSWLATHQALISAKTRSGAGQR